MPTKIYDVASSLWGWQCTDPGTGAFPPLNSTFVESNGVSLVIDPTVPDESGAEVWKRLDANPPSTIVILKPDHVRDADIFAHRYRAKIFGPRLFYPDDVPTTPVEAVDPDDTLPGKILALYDGRNRLETPAWLPQQRTIVFADGMCGLTNRLQIWDSPWLTKRVIPAMSEMLALPFERVIVGHGQPLHDRAAFERALGAPPWRE